MSPQASSTPAPPAAPLAPPPRSRRAWLLVLAALVLATLAAVLWLREPFPSAETPEGAYLRLARAVAEDKLTVAFSYLEKDAQDGCYTVQRSRKKAYELVAAHFPEPERGEWLARYETEAKLADGPEVFALYARERGWVERLRRDLSGIDRVERSGDRATVVTVRDTRYTFRQPAEGGGFGLTMFSAELAAEGLRAARDLEVVERAAADYAAAAAAPK